MTRYLILLALSLPSAAMAATRHSAQYYFTHPDARVAVEVHCYPGTAASVTADNCRNAWQAGRQIVHSVTKAPSQITGWGSVERMASTGKPIYPTAPEEQADNPAYWRLRGASRTRAFLTNWASCPAHPTSAFIEKCKAAREALAAPWQPTNGGQQ